MTLCGLFTIIALAILIVGVAVMALGAVVVVIWVIGLIIALLATGGPGGAAYAVSFPILFIGGGIVFIGFLIYSLGVLLTWAASVMCQSGASASGFSGFMGNGGKLPGLNPGGLFGGLFGGPGLFGLLFLTLEERQKLQPDLLRLVECMRGCLCGSLCGGSHGRAPDPAQVVVDAGKTLLEDLRAQLEHARQKLEDAQGRGDLTSAAYWSNKITDLTRRIAELAP